MLHVQNILRPSFYFTAMVIIAAACGLVPQSLCSFTGTLAGGPGSFSPILKHLELSESRDRVVITRIRDRLCWREKCLLCSHNQLAFSFFSEIWHLVRNNSNCFFFPFFSFFMSDRLSECWSCRTQWRKGWWVGLFLCNYIISYAVNGTNITALMWDNAI